MKRFVYTIPYDGKMQVFEVVKWVKKEAVLKDARGGLTRITPSQFEYYAETPESAVRRALNTMSRRFSHLKKDLKECESRLAKIHHMLMAFQIQNRQVGKA